MNMAQLFGIAFWASVALSTLIAILGVWRAERWWLIASALISVPFVIVTVAHPSTRYFAVVPFLHILAAIAVKGFPRWIAWVLLLALIAVAGLFLLVLFGAVG